MQNFSPTTINNFLNNIDDFYQSFIDETIDFLENSFPKNILQESIYEHLILILNHELKQPFDGVSFYWFQRVQDLLYIGELLYNMNNESAEEVVKELQEDIFIFWNNLGFGIPQNPLLSTNLEKASNELLGLLEQQITSFYYLHVNNEIEMPHPCLYFPIEELNENSTQIGIDYPFYVTFEQQELPIVIKSRSDLTLHLEESEIDLSQKEVKNSTSTAFNNYIKNIPSLYPIWPKLIKGCIEPKRPGATDLPFLQCSSNDGTSGILKSFSQHILSLFDLLNDSFEDDDFQEDEQLTRDAQEWLLWLYKHEEKNSSFISLISL